MWALLSRRVRRVVFVAVAAPAVGWVLEQVATQVESRRGASGLTRQLNSSGGWLRQRGWGRLGRRGP